MRPRLKICGIRTPEDLAAAVEAGADALGFNFYPPSPRALEPSEAAELVARVPLWVDPVALFVNEPVARIRSVANAIGVRTLQLHGHLPPEKYDELAEFRIVLAVPAVAGETVARLAPYRERIAAVLLDAAVTGMHGGTGRRADWDEVRRVQEAYPELPLILAGGLTPENVAAAVQAVAPYAVDVASGVERAPGMKDAAKMQAFATALRRA